MASLTETQSKLAETGLLQENTAAELRRLTQIYDKKLLWALRQLNQRYDEGEFNRFVRHVLEFVQFVLFGGAAVGKDSFVVVRNQAPPRNLEVAFTTHVSDKEAGDFAAKLLDTGNPGAFGNASAFGKWSVEDAI